MVSLVWAAAGVIALTANPIAAPANILATVFPPMVVLLLLIRQFGTGHHLLMQSHGLWIGPATGLSGKSGTRKFKPTQTASDCTRSGSGTNFTDTSSYDAHTRISPNLLQGDVARDLAGIRGAACQRLGEVFRTVPELNLRGQRGLVRIDHGFNPTSGPQLG